MVETLKHETSVCCLTPELVLVSRQTECKEVMVDALHSIHQSVSVWDLQQHQDAALSQPKGELDGFCLGLLLNSTRKPIFCSAPLGLTASLSLLSPVDFF